MTEPAIRKETEPAISRLEYATRYDWCVADRYIRHFDAIEGTETGIIETARPFLSMLVSGRVTVHGKKKCIDVVPGTVAFYPESYIRNVEITGRGVRWVVVDIPDRILSRLRISRRITNGGSMRTDHPKLFTCIARILGQVVLNTDDSLWDAMDHLDQLFSDRLEIDLGRRTPSTLAVRAKELVSRSYSQPLGLKKAGEALQANPSHLGRAFRERYGCSLGDYLRHVRVREAIRLMSRSNSTLSDIALRCGFADQSHMCRTFQDVISISPSRARLLT